jgi:kinesin family protein C2/C3
MSAVIVCLLALRDRFGSNVGEGLHCSLEGKSRMHSMEFPIRENGHCTQNSEFGEKVKGSIPKVSTSPAPSGKFFPPLHVKLSAVSRRDTERAEQSYSISFAI